MKDERNFYNITNEGASGGMISNEGRIKYSNDDPHAVSESFRSGPNEVAQVAESYDSSTAEEESSSASVESDASASTSGAESTASSAASSAASAASSVGSSIGAMAGMVASSVATVAMVVVVFVSTLVINLSLLMADMHTLVFGVELVSAQEEDFEDPIWAILTSEDGTRMEQEVKQDTVMLTFDGLEEGREYLLTVKNESKVFAEISAFTTTEPNSKGEIVSFMQGNDVFVTVQKAELKASEYYTIVAKDAQGNTLFTKDGVDLMTPYSFKVDKPQDLYFYLMVSGKTYAISQIELPVYDVENGVWAWSDDYSSANVTFTDKRGGEPIVLTATITRKKTDPTCDEDGALVRTAKVVYEGKTYTDKKTTVIEALGHDYEGIFDGNTITYTCSRCGDSYSDDE